MIIKIERRLLTTTGQNGSFASLVKRGIGPPKCDDVCLRGEGSLHVPSLLTIVVVRCFIWRAEKAITLFANEAQGCIHSSFYYRQPALPVTHWTQPVPVNSHKTHPYFGYVEIT